MTAIAAPPQRQGIVLNASWEAYVRIGELLRDQPIRMTYNRGALEIMTLSLEHENIKTLLARMVEYLLIELNIDMRSGGSTTFRQEEREQGLEADECYWIQHVEQMRGKTAFDPDTDPPPDLALEVEVSRSVLPRLRIYASLGIPEIWRYDGQAIHVLLRDTNGEYQESPTSAALPMVPVAELSQFLELLRTTSETQVSRQFFDWVRKQQAAGWAAKKPRGRKKK